MDTGMKSKDSQLTAQVYKHYTQVQKYTHDSQYTTTRFLKCSNAQILKCTKCSNAQNPQMLKFSNPQNAQMHKIHKCTKCTNAQMLKFMHKCSNLCTNFCQTTDLAASRTSIHPSSTSFCLWAAEWVEVERCQMLTRIAVVDVEETHVLSTERVVFCLFGQVVEKRSFENRNHVVCQNHHRQKHQAPNA